MMENEIIEKLKKLFALAQQGMEGERQNAQSLLEALMKKHGISMSQIVSEESAIEWFKPQKGEYQKRLLIQVIAQVCGRKPCYSSEQKKGMVGVDATKSQVIEVKLRYESYVKELSKQMETFYRAFVQKNDIYPQEPLQDKESTLTQEEIKEILKFMSNMDQVKIHQRLDASA